jgi:hypothetical protein
MDRWLNYDMSMNDIAVLEPVQRTAGDERGPASAAQGEKR